LTRSADGGKSEGGRDRGQKKIVEGGKNTKVTAKRTGLGINIPRLRKEEKGSLCGSGKPRDRESVIQKEWWGGGNSEEKKGAKWLSFLA